MSLLSKTWIRKEQNWKLGGSSLNNLDSYICGQYIVVKYKVCQIRNIYVWGLQLIALSD